MKTPNATYNTLIQGIYEGDLEPSEVEIYIKYETSREVWNVDEYGREEVGYNIIDSSIDIYWNRNLYNALENEIIENWITENRELIIESL